MRWIVLCAALALGVAGVVYAAGPEGDAVISALEKCGFVDKTVGGVPGGGATMAVTEDTIKKLQKMMKDGKGFHIADGGQVTVVDLKPAKK